MIQKIILTDKKNIPNVEENFVVINKMEIKDYDNLLIGITFHGGCKEHLFRLFGFLEDDNSLILLLEHNSNGDQCKSILRKELLFDLSPIKNDYSITNRNNLNNSSLILKLKNLETKYEIRND